MKYDRTYGLWVDGTLQTKQSTIQNVDMLGRAETFIVQTMRRDDLGDMIFVQVLDENAVAVRLALPPKVANTIASQRDSLSRRRRRAVGKATMQARMAQGFKPSLPRRKKAHD